MLWWERIGLTEEQGRVITDVCTKLRIAGIDADEYALANLVLGPSAETIAAMNLDPTP
jgi:hypothetical protein